MDEYLVEFYVSRLDADGPERCAAAARTAAEDVTRRGAPVRYVRSIFVPDDETCFFLYEAGSVAAVAEAARRAALPFERVAAVAERP